MARGAYVVRVRPVSPEREGELNEWYDRVHIPQLLAVPGFVSARRFRRVGDSGPEYLTVYEIEADDVETPLRELRRRSAAGETTRSDALQRDPAPIVGLYEELGPTAAETHPDAAAVVTELGLRFRAGDRDGARALLHPDLRIEQPTSLPHGGSHHGSEGMDAMGARFAEHWDRTIGEADIRGCGDTAVQVTTQTWTAKATGRSATVDVVELFRVAEGRVVEIRVFQQDTHALLATLDDPSLEAG
jgi:ketosteroid isomerase-like protein